MLLPKSQIPDSKIALANYIQFGIVYAFSILVTISSKMARVEELQ